jgi:ABC-2 type transport system permease protein
MKLRNIKTIIAREYLTRVKKKSFLLITFLGPIFFAAIAVLPSVIMFMAEDKGKQVAVIDESGIVMPMFVDTEAIDYTDCTGQHLDSLKTNLVDLGYDALVHISPIEADTKSVSVTAYSSSPMSVDMKAAISSRVDDAVEDYRLSQYEIDDLKQIMKDVKFSSTVTTYTLGEDGEEKITSSEVYMIISLVLSMIIYFFVAMFSGMVMQSVIEEKASRVVEVLVSSVKATELMFGKIIGVACVALTQFLLWIVLTLVIVAGVSSFVGLDSMMNSATVQTEQMTQLTDQLGVDPEAMQMAMPDPSSIAQNSEFSAVLSTLKDLNYGMLLFSFIIYFVLGYLMYASFFAAIGSAVENEADTQQLSIPVTIPLMLGFFIAFYAFKAPDSAVVFWGSMIPFTSPIVMLARIPFGVPVWEVALSMSILVATFIACGWASAKIYKIGILMFGKKTSFKDLWKWLRMK